MDTNYTYMINNCAIDIVRIKIMRGEVYTGFWWGKLRERGHLGDPGVGGRIVLRRIFCKWDVGAWAGSSWLRIGTGGWHL
jgi:hypothetical protein